MHIYFYLKSKYFFIILRSLSMKLLKDTFRQRMGFKFSYVLILIILVLPMTATAFDITGPMSITEPGTYDLQVDILNQASGIQIYSSDVTIDGNGHTIDGTGSSGTGILIGGTGSMYSNIEIRNLVLSDWLLGISVPMTASGASEASDVLIKNVQFTMAGSGTRGIYGYAVTDAVIDSCTFTGTPFAAIEFPVGAVRPTVRDSHFTGGQHALLINGLQAAPGGAVFSGNTIEGATIGLYANYFTGAEITGNTVRSNQEGIRIGSMTGTTITGNTVTSNTSERPLTLLLQRQHDREQLLQQHTECLSLYDRYQHLGPATSDRHEHYRRPDAWWQLTGAIPLVQASRTPPSTLTMMGSLTRPTRSNM